MCRESSVVVQKKVRGKSKKSRKKKVNRPNPTPVLSDEEKAQRWESMATIIEENLQVMFISLKYGSLLV